MGDVVAPGLVPAGQDLARRAFHELGAQIDPMRSQPSRAQAESDELSASFRKFIPAAWPILEPTTPFVSGRHIDATAEHLEALTFGEIKKLLINIPPGFMKSRLLVLWNAWEWTFNPSSRWLCGSYDKSLSIRDCRHCRRVIQSEWYQARWGHVFQLAGDQNLKRHFENDKTGVRQAISLQGGTTGKRGDRLNLDDPHDVEKTESETDRNGKTRWFSETWPSRGNPGFTMCVVMQRIHTGDIAGYILANYDDWEHLCMPMHYDPKRIVDIGGYDGGELPDHPIFEPTALGFRDWRKKAEELLWPQLYDLETVDSLAAGMTEYAVAGQLEQRPAPRGGGAFKIEHIRLLDVAPVQGKKVRFWDIAGTEDGGNYTVGTLGQLTPEGLFCVLDVIRGRWSSGMVDEIVCQTAALDGHDVAIREEQEPGSSGKAVIAARARKLIGYDYQGIRATGDKETRWRPLAAYVESNNVYALKAAWNKAWLEELSVVPNANHDDQADSVSGAFNELAIPTKKRARSLRSGPSRLQKLLQQRNRPR